MTKEEIVARWKEEEKVWRENERDYLLAIKLASDALRQFSEDLIAISAMLEKAKEEIKRLQAKET
jgi:hypothetical protein